ncbi:MAG TPA: helix-turn-helix domain-containing protein [Blastocatellia bacterium]|nr:helix-turn-helix domain-containing protein [Blastocatellia bacterium]
MKQTYYTERQAARYLSIALNTLRKYRRLGVIQASKTGTVVVYDKTALDVFQTKIVRPTKSFQPLISKLRPLCA